MSETRQDKIRAILETLNKYLLGYGLPAGAIPAAAEAIAALPVDKIEVMAALVCSTNELNSYNVLDASGTYLAICVRGIHWRCYKRGNVILSPHCDSIEGEQLCDHIQAVKLYLERRAKE